MSGGLWDYRNDDLAREIFTWSMSPNYGNKGFSQANAARARNPLEDKMISELVWDVLCLLHSFDWYKCGDTCEDTYKKDLKYFKNKWLKVTPNELLLREIDKTLVEARVSLKQSFELEDE